MAYERLHSARLRWNNVVDEIDEYEELTSGSVAPPSPDAGWRAHLGYKWKTTLKKPVLRGLALFSAFMSLVIIWSELTVALPVNLSPWGLILSAFAPSSHQAGVDREQAEAFFFQLFALIPYVYMSGCTYYSLFTLRLFGLFTLQGPQQSATGPLIFNAIYLISLQFPMGYTYLTMLSPPHAHGSDLAKNVAFNELMHHMETVPLFGQDFFVYAPILLGVLCLCSYYHLYPRLLKLVGIDHEDIDSAETEEGAERLKEGMSLIEKHRRKEEREKRRNGVESEVTSALHSRRPNNSVELTASSTRSGYSKVKHQDSADFDDQV